MNRHVRTILILAVLALGAWALVYGGLRSWMRTAWFADPTSVARASLEAVREQNRLTPFAARFVAVVTSEQSRFGFSARKTLIMPGMVRYEVDLARLQQRDLRWDGATSTLSVTLPPIEIAGPDVDLAATKEYGEGGVLMALTDAEKQLDAANRKAGQTELLAQARGETPMRLAREAARSAIQRSFAMPLRAAGIAATVTVRFADER
jgi:hypothetical protein